MSRSASAHVLLIYLAPGLPHEVTARLDFCPTSEEGEWGVLLDGQPIGRVVRECDMWRPVWSMKYFKTRLGAATHLTGARRYYRLSASRVPIMQVQIMQRLRGREWWDVHRVRRELGIATQP